MRQFWRDRQGNVAILFALAVVPVIGAMGAALDYSMANSYRSAMQKAVDATALALSKVMPLQQAELDKVALQYFNANFGDHGLANLVVTATPGKGNVQIDAKADYDPVMAKLFGATQFEIGAEAIARWSIGKVEVALVLDNSGSMNDHNRMTHLQTAAKDLLDVLKDAATEPGDARVAVVPFDQRVNVGKSYVNESWLNWSEWDAENGSYETVQTCSGNKGKGKGKGNCTTTKVWEPDDHDEWDGCVLDRDKDNDVQDTAPSGNSTKYLASQCDHGLPFPGRVVQMRRLTDNWDALKSTINAMQPAGYTNIGIGLVWGWHLLSPTDVATEAQPYGTEDLTKYVVLMTDGDNTRNRWGSHNGWSNDMDARTSLVCENIKKQGIQIFAIRLVSGNATLLQNCASNPTMYFDVQDASMLSGVFKAIGSQIASLHLSK